MKKQYKVIVGVLIGIILLITIIKVFNIKQIILQKIYPKKYSEYVEKYAQEFNVDPLLIFSMIKAESNFKEKAKSSSGAKGLMQLMEATANEIADKIDEPLVEEESLLEPEKNIMNTPVRDAKESILDKVTLKTILTRGSIIGIVTIIAQYIGMQKSPELGCAMAFLTLTLSRIFHIKKQICMLGRLLIIIECTRLFMKEHNKR